MQQQLGKKGEFKAQEFLVANGYKILNTNWKSRHYEIDIIAIKDNTLIIVEVKTRSTDYFGNPSDFVQSKKHQSLYKATEEYICQNNYSGEIRFDIIAIYPKDDEWIIEHIEDAFYPN